MTGPALIVLPDDELLVCGWLAGRPEIVATGAVVGDRLPEGYDGSQPAVTVSRIGGATDRAGGGQWLDRPRLDVTCWGKDKAAAKDLSAQVRALMAVARFDDHSAAGAVWSDTSEDVGPQWIPSTQYPESGRYLLQYSILIHPTIA